MSGSWGASFGSGMWGALDREARDFQARRIARKEEERRKRLAEEERLRQEALANQRAENLFEMNNQSMEPMFAATGMAGMTPYVSGAIQKVFDQAGANGSTVGGIMNAQQDMLAQKAYEDQQKKEEQERELNDYNQKIRKFNLWKNENAMHEYEDLQALKPELERKKQEEEALKKKQDQEYHDARIRNINADTSYKNALAGNVGKSNGHGGNGKVQEQIDPEEQKFLDNEKDFNRQLQDLDRDIERLNGDARGYESDSFDKADAAKRDANALRDRRKEIIKKRDSNRSEYQKWKASKNKPAAKTSSSKLKETLDLIGKVLSGVGTNFERTFKLNEITNKIRDQFDEEQARKEAAKRRLAEEARNNPMSDYDRGIQERGELYGNIGRSISDFFSRGKKAVSDYFEGSKKAYAEQKAIEALKNPEKAQLDALYNQGKIFRAEYMRKLSVLNGL